MPKRKFTEEDFNKAKDLQSLGMNTVQSGEMLGRPTSTMSYAYKAENYEQFKFLQRKSYMLYRKAKTSSDSDNTKDWIASINSKLDRIIEMLGEHNARD